MAELGLLPSTITPGVLTVLGDILRLCADDPALVSQNPRLPPLVQACEGAALDAAADGAGLADIRDWLMNAPHSDTGVSRRAIETWFEGKVTPVRLKQLHVFCAFGDADAPNHLGGSRATGAVRLSKRLSAASVGPAARPWLAVSATRVREYVELLELFFAEAMPPEAWACGPERGVAFFEIRVDDKQRKYSVWTARGVRAYRLTRQYLTAVRQMPHVLTPPSNGQPAPPTQVGRQAWNEAI
jgi:hypothetical protein